MVTAYKRAVQSLWDGRAVITVQEGAVNPDTGRTEPVERVLAEDVPCRIAYKTVQAVEPEEEAARPVQTVTLYVDPAVDVPAGSRITVTQKGVTRVYERSGKEAGYSAHKEIPLVLRKEWA